MIDTHTMHSSYVSVEPRPVDNSDSLKAPSYHQPSYSGPSNNNLHSQMAVTSAPPARMVPITPSTSNGYNQSYSDMHSSLHPYVEDRSSADPKDNSASFSASTSDLKLSSEQEANQPAAPVVAATNMDGNYQPDNVGQSQPDTSNSQDLVRSSSGYKPPMTSEPISTNYLGNSNQHVELHQANVVSTNQPPIQQVPNPTSQPPVSSDPGYSQPAYPPQPPPQHPTVLAAGLEQTPQSNVGQSNYPQPNTYASNQPVFQQNIADATAPSVRPHFNPKENLPTSSYRSNQESGYLSQTNSQQPLPPNQQVPDRNYHQALNVRDHTEPPIHHRHSVPTISSHQTSSYNDGHYHNQPSATGQPDGYPHVSSNLHAPSQNRGAGNHREPSSHRPASGYGAPYYQNTSNQPENAERVPSRPPSRSSITGESTYVPYQEKSNYDQYNSYNRPRSRQGHDYDQRYSGRYNNEYDDYYRARNQDYYNRSYSRDYYQGQGDYYRKYSGYYDQRYYYDRRTSEPQGSRYYQDQYYNQQRSYNDWRSQGQAYDPRYYDNQDRSKVDSYNASNVQDQSSYATNNFNESVQQGYQYKGEHTLEDTTSYPNTFDEETWPNLPQVPARRTPVKFNSAHPILRFGAGGVLIHVLPNSPVDGKPATVEISSVETLLEDTSEAEEFRSYPGPLSRKETHKIDVVSFTTQQSNQSQRRTDLVDRNSVSLTWDFLSVLVRQNGTIMGTDVAELLMRDHSGNFDLMQSPNDMQRRPPPNTDEPVNQNDEANVNSEDNTTLRFRDLLLYGRKKDALEWAMKSNLWGHALLLASKTDARTHANVMLRFANSLPINDPLQTLYQLMSGRQPAATTCITEEEWGDWRPHLAMMLSNTTDSISLDTKVVMTLGDTLLAKGLLDAAHFCYLMATSPLGYYSKKSAKLVLIGSNHTLPFYEFATNEGIRKSECYEYALALGHATNRTKMEFMPALQIYKLIYAGRLMELGLVEKAFHYCENIAKFVCKSPNLYSVTLVSQLTELINVMQYHDPRVQAGGQLSSDLRWIQSLLAVNERMGKSSLGSLPPPSTISPSLISSVTSHLDSSSSGEEEDEEVRELPSPQEMVQNIYQQRDQNQPIQNVQLDGYQVNAPAQPVEPTFYQPHQVESLMQQSNPLPQQQQQQQLQQHHQQQQQQQDFEQQPQFNQQQFPPQQQQNNQPPPLFQPQQQQNYQQPQFYPNQPAEFQNSQIAQQPPVKNQPTNDHYNQYPSMPSHEAVSRVRTTSQTSHQSHTSHASQRSRKSTGRRSRTTSETSHRSRSRSTSAESIKKEKAAEKEKKGWGIMNWFTKKKVNQVHLPDDNVKELVWDPVRKRWTNGEEEEEEELAPPPPMEATPASAPDAPMPSGGLTRNKFSLKNLNNRSMYKDAFGGGATTSSSQNIAPPSLFPVAPSQQSNPSVFIPKPVPTSGPSEAVNQENHNLAESQNLKHLEKQQQQEQNNFQPQQQPPMFQPQQSNQQQQQQQYDQQDNIQPQQNHQQQQQNHQQPQFNQQQQFNPQQQFQPQVNDQNLQQQQLQPQSNFQQQQPFMPQQQYQPDIQQKQQPQQIQQHPNPNQVNTPPPSTDPPQVAPSNPVPQSDPVAAPPMTTFYNPTQFGAGQNSNPFSQPTAPTRGGFSSRRGRGRSYPKISGK